MTRPARCQPERFDVNQRILVRSVGTTANGATASLEQVLAPTRCRRCWSTGPCPRAATSMCTGRRHHPRQRRPWTSSATASAPSSTSSHGAADHGRHSRGRRRLRSGRRSASGRGADQHPPIYPQQLPVERGLLADDGDLCRMAPGAPCGSTASQTRTSRRTDPALSDAGLHADSDARRVDVLGQQLRVDHQRRRPSRCPGPSITRPPTSTSAATSMRRCYRPCARPGQPGTDARHDHPHRRVGHDSAAAPSCAAR